MADCFAGRTQSAFAVIATLLQIAMSFALGWLAKHTSLQLAFLLLGLLYATVVVAATGTRNLQSSQAKRMAAN